MPTEPQTTSFPTISLGLLAQSPQLEKFGLKLSPGGAHISRTMMLAELEALLSALSAEASASEYAAAILDRNVLGKATQSTRQKSLRHLRELYSLDPATPLFGLLRELYYLDPASLPQLAIQVAWARDPLLRSTTPPIMDADEGGRVETAALSAAVGEAFPEQYSELNCNKVARNAASSWTQSGHLVRRTKKTRSRVNPSSLALAMALFLGDATGFRGAAVFSSPWCRLLDLSPDEARRRAFEANRAGLLNLRAVGEVVELDFPRFRHYQQDRP